MLTIGDVAARRHQFLLSLERQHSEGSFGLETECVSLPDTQRERGEMAIEGVGTLELVATERAGMHRIDVRELHRSLHSLARLPILSAFRYQRSATVTPGLALSVERFPDAGVLAAVADHAVATTLVTTEGRALTEMVLRVQNRAQPFLKVSLPGGRHHGVGRSGGPEREARPRRRRHQGPAAPARLPADRRVPTCRSCTSTPGHPSPGKGRCRWPCHGWISRSV